jgi:hypothetical protein
MSEFDFSADWDADGHDAPASDGSEGLGAFDHDAGFNDYGHDAGLQDFGHDAGLQDLGHDAGFGDFGHADLDTDADDYSDGLGHDDSDALDDLLSYDGFGGHGGYDLVGADPDEEGLWDQLMLDMTDDVNPYVAN